MRGAVNGLMADVLEGHLRESFGHAECDATSMEDPEHARTHEVIGEVADLVRRYLR